MCSAWLSASQSLNARVSCQRRLFSCCRPSFIHDNWSGEATPLMDGDGLWWCGPAACRDILQLIRNHVIGSDHQMDICTVSVQIGATAVHWCLCSDALVPLVFSLVFSHLQFSILFSDAF